MLLRQLKFNFGFINANVYPLAVAKSKPDLRLAKGCFKFRGPVTPGDGSGAASDKPNRADENLQPSDRLPFRTAKNANLQPSSEKNVIFYFAHAVYVLPIYAPNELSDPAHGTQRLQPRRSRRVRCSACSAAVSWQPDNPVKSSRLAKRLHRAIGRSNSRDRSTRISPCIGSQL